MSDELRTPTPTETPTQETQIVSNAPAYLWGRQLGEILKSSTGLTDEKLNEALAAQAEKGGRLGEVLVALKHVTEEDVARALAAQLDIPYLARIFPDEVDGELVKKVPINFAKQARILPLYLEGDTVAMAVADPLDTT